MRSRTTDQMPVANVWKYTLDLAMKHPAKSHPLMGGRHGDGQPPLLARAVQAGPVRGRGSVYRQRVVPVEVTSLRPPYDSGTSGLRRPNLSNTATVVSASGYYNK